MAWSGSNRFGFKESWVLIYAPVGSGVYAIYSQERWLYIGEAEDMRGRLLRHLEGDDPCIAESRPTHFAFQSVAPQDRVARQRELIAEYRPLCNRQAGPDRQTERPDGE
ncbi:MAG TPA: GIY-YIG nuclease family protein [Candidatus Methylomirabilis sp.]|nr:GIY-YIG nuclease family protein [Candidatus Methylomirabilis sp.]